MTEHPSTDHIALVGDLVDVSRIIVVDSKQPWLLSLASRLKRIARVKWIENLAQRNSPVIRKVASNAYFWIGVCVASFICHAAWAYISKCNMPLARCGATWAICSSFVVARPVVRLGFEHWFAMQSIIDGGHFKPTPKEIEAKRQAALDAKSMQTIGPAMLIVSTLMWAYGDLFGPY